MSPVEVLALELFRVALDPQHDHAAFAAAGAHRREGDYLSPFGLVDANRKRPVFAKLDRRSLHRQGRTGARRPVHDQLGVELETELAGLALVRCSRSEMRQARKAQGAPE